MMCKFTLEVIFFLIKDGGFNMADGSISFFSNKWRHHYITTMVKDFFCVSKLLDFISHFTIYNYFSFYEGNLDSANKYKSMTP